MVCVDPMGGPHAWCVCGYGRPRFPVLADDAVIVSAPPVPRSVGVAPPSTNVELAVVIGAINPLRFDARHRRYHTYMDTRHPTSKGAVSISVMRPCGAFSQMKYP